MSELPKPDILVPYRDLDSRQDLGLPSGRVYALAYVRPETNRSSYEGEIVRALRGRAELVYMANLNGRLFSEGGILASHYASQFRFARDPRAFLGEYPELAGAFERHFGIPADEADIMGSVSAVEWGFSSAEELFSTIVDDADFLASYGQTFKLIRGKYIVNYDLPAISSRYTPEADCFVVLVRAEGGADGLYAELNKAIYKEISSSPDTPLVDGQALEGLAWSERVRRTYHLSANRIMAMIDMADFVYLSGDGRLDVADTPLGRSLVAEGLISASQLRAALATQLCRIGPAGSPPETLVYLPQPGRALGAEGVRGLFRRIASFLS
jgi:hypothetical protein